jgi:hypothetical protein
VENLKQNTSCGGVHSIEHHKLLEPNLQLPKFHFIG